MKETKLICNAGSIEQKAAMLSDMLLLDVTGGGIVHTYTDAGLASIRNSYKRMLALLQADDDDRPTGRKHYS